MFLADQNAISVLESSVSRCPHCQSSHYCRWGRASGLIRYGQCQKTFNCLTGKPLARLRYKARWLRYARTMADGLSVRKAAKTCDVHKNTAFRWRHRFLKQPEQARPAVLAGIVEIDETFFWSHTRGRGGDRAPRKRGGKAGKRGLSAEQIPVLIARDRSGATTDATLPKATARQVAEVLATTIAPDAILCTDSNPIYAAFARHRWPYPPTSQPFRWHPRPGKGLPHPKRQCLRQSTQRLDAPFPRRSDQISQPLSGLAAYARKTPASHTTDSFPRYFKDWFCQPTINADIAFAKLSLRVQN